MLDHSVLDAPRSTPDGRVFDATQIHIVELAADSSAAAARQVLRSLSGGRVLVVIAPSDRKIRPGSGSGFASESGLVLLQSLRRQADVQDLELAIVSRNEHLRIQAAEAGVPAFGTVETARARAWGARATGLDRLPPEPRRDAGQMVNRVRHGTAVARSRTRTIAAGRGAALPSLLQSALLALFLVFSLLAVTAVLAFLIPVAEVQMVPAHEPLAATIRLTARSDQATLSSSNLLMPARRIGQRVEVEGSLATTGKNFAPSESAQGTVLFTNRRPQSLEIPAGTVVATSTGSNIRFETTEPAGLGGGVGAQAYVPIKAIDPGPIGNVRAFTINTIEGPLGVVANVVNPGATGGGDVKEVATVDQADKDTLRARLETEARQKAYVALGELLEEGEFVPSETVGTLVIEETYDHFTDEPAEEITLRLRMLSTALAVDGAAADDLALRALADKLPRRGQLVSDSVQWTRGAATVTEEGDAVVITFDDTASALVVVDIDPSLVSNQIRGMKPDEAIATLQSAWRLQTAPTLTLGPEWLQSLLHRLDFGWLPLPVAGRVPWLSFRTYVDVRYAPQPQP